MNKCMKCPTSINCHHDVLGLIRFEFFFLLSSTSLFILLLCWIPLVFASYHECISLIQDVAKLQGHGVLSSSIFFE